MSPLGNSVKWGRLVANTVDTRLAAATVKQPIIGISPWTQFDRARVSSLRALARCQELASGRYSDRPGQLFRPYLGGGYRETLATLQRFMLDAGMTAKVDNAANIVGRYEGDTIDAPTLMIGSHLDSVSDAGCYDGMLGILLGIECVAIFAQLGCRLPFAVEVIGFGDEEGSRFASAMLCSRAVAGALDRPPPDMSDIEGITLKAALADFGLDLERFRDARRPAGSICAYIEAHIEQGPVLEKMNMSLGVVNSIAAQRRYEVNLVGKAGHAGTTPMELRNDALAAAAEIVLAVETIGIQSEKGVATVGKLVVLPGGSNVVPGHVLLSIDLRSETDSEALQMAMAISKRIDRISKRRTIDVEIKECLVLKATTFDSELVDRVERAVSAVNGECCRLLSGAGHDAMVMSALAPSAMLFIRCKDGTSHNPNEFVAPEDADAALRAMLHFLENFAQDCEL